MTWWVSLSSGIGLLLGLLFLGIPVFLVFLILNVAGILVLMGLLPPPESPPGAAAVEAFRASGLEYPRVTVFAVLPEVRIRLLATGRFLTVFPNSVLANSKLRSVIRVLPVKMELPHIPTGIVTLKNRTLSPAAKLFIEHAREVTKSLAANKL
jgi:DNA-binding transcriptional LysR family regulator